MLRGMVATVLVASGLLIPSATTAADDRPNVVFIVTDDQRWDTLWAMPTVQSELVGKGMNFSNGFVVNASCCPSRTSMLTGEYSHSTGVYTNNDDTFGGFPAFNDESTLATWLDDAGYETALFGKYLNRYSDPSYVPPGWDHWTAQMGGPYYGYRLTDGLGGTTEYGSDEGDYATDVLADRADQFIRDVEPGDPLFLWFAPPAPHWPADPAPRHIGTFADLEEWRPPSYNERDVSDKPRYIQRLSRLNWLERSELDGLRVLQYQTLLSADEAVGQLLAALEDSGRLNNTIVIYVSDNGLHWGEHRWNALKRLPYEESIRIPYVVRYDPVTAGSATVEERLVANIDLAPTVAELAGLEAPGAEGESLVPLLDQSASEWRGDFLVEHMGTNKPPSYCAVRSEGALYVRYADGAQEYYRLAVDPYEERNVAGRERFGLDVRAMKDRAKELCDPTPPLFSWRTSR